VTAADPFKHVVFTVTELDLEENYDFLSLKDGYTSDDSLLMARLTGNELPEAPFVTSLPSGFVYFITDGGVRAKGFTVSCTALLGVLSFQPHCKK
jgi:hypothetical protein